MKLKLLICFIVYSVTSLALDSSNVNRDLHEINTKINQVNSGLIKKHQQQQNISQALKSSEEAINQSSVLLSKLKSKRLITIQQLSNIRNSLTEMQQSIATTQSSLLNIIRQIYQQIQYLKTKKQSILSGNEGSDENRKKVYLIAILEHEQNKLQLLQNKINRLNSISDNLQKEITQLNNKLGNTVAQKQKLQNDQQKKSQKSQVLKTQIDEDELQINHLKEQQTKLNHLMNQIIANELAAKAKEQHIHKINPENSNKEQIADNKAGYNDTSSFLLRKITKPINAKIALGFGATRDNVANKGVLFNYTENANVQAVSDGKVMFTGNLPGFGRVIIIDHGNDYMSIYSGVISQVKVGAKITAGQIIANSGNKDNQPLGGIYFELRHLGKPVDPTKLVS
jgi:septal ring factor EnvC (AmiA/AmiB activator)